MTLPAIAESVSKLRVKYDCDWDHLIWLMNHGGLSSEESSLMEIAWLNAFLHTGTLH